MPIFSHQDNTTLSKVGEESGILASLSPFFPPLFFWIHATPPLNLFCSILPFESKIKENLEKGT
jgi:hypothetical protein